METPQTDQKSELIKRIPSCMYSTSPIIHREITGEEFITDITDFLAKEIIDRRRKIKGLPLLAELGVLQQESQ